MTWFIIFLCILLAATEILLTYVYFYSLKIKEQLEYIKANQAALIQEGIAKGKTASLNTSRNVIKGQIAESMLPLLQLKNLGFLPSDMQFFGKLFDYIIIDGYSACKDNNEEIRQVIFADVKTGKAELSEHQESFKRAVNKGKIKFVTLHVDDAGNVSIHE